jgi:hypothetical protein
MATKKTIFQNAQFTSNWIGTKDQDFTKLNSHKKNVGVECLSMTME